MESTDTIIQGKTGDWELMIGLEVHAQISSKSKLFSGAATAFGAEPNSQVSFVDAAMPGMLPVINAACVREAVRSGLALNCRINRRSVFARKNYFYADLPQGYQISQYEEPVVGEGEITIDMPDGTNRTIGIERLHLEQDAGKSLHDQLPDKSLIDLNRSGVALMEIVSRPDMRSAEEAGAYLTKLRAVLRCIGACDGNMQEGSLRADANVSVRRPGEAPGTRCEIKNLNSVRFLKQAIMWEARRQVALLESGGTVSQETRLFDSARGETRPMRSKEDAHDYRYFPDPDLPPLLLDEAFIESARESLPELPDAKKARFIREFGLRPHDAGLLCADTDVSAYYEETAAQCDPALAANWILSELFGLLNKTERAISESPVGPGALAALIRLISDNVISGKIAKDVFAEMFATGKAPDAIVAEKGLRQITDTGALEAVVSRIISENPDQVAAFRGGKTGLMGWFVGQAMKATGGKANPKALNEILQRALSQES